MFEQEYKDVFSKVTASGDTLRKVLGMEQKEPKAHSKVIYLALVAALICLMVACAAAVYDSRPMLEAIFGTNGRSQYDRQKVLRMYRPAGERSELDLELAEKYIAPHIHEADGSIQSGDTVLSVEAYIVDRATSTGAVYLKMENPPEYKVLNDGQILWYKDKSIGSTRKFLRAGLLGTDITIGRFYIAEEMTTEDTLYFVLFYARNSEDDQMEFYFEDSDDRITVDFSAKSAMKNITLFDGNIRLSPFGMELVSKPFGFEDVMVTMECSIQYRNGEEYVLQWREDGQGHVNYTYGSALDVSRSSMVYIFNRVVDVNEVKSVIVNGEEYLVE